MAAQASQSPEPIAVGRELLPPRDIPAPAPARIPEPARIRRNTACVGCRDAKVKCNASLTPNQPCMRCSKLELKCVVDKSHKRTSRRSKLEELAAEVRTIKDAVAPRPFLTRPRSYSTATENPILTPSRSDAASGEGQVRAAEPRALGSRVFSGQDIAYYFDKYFEHFHPYFPVVRGRDPDICYRRGPVLFWAIILVSCRRFARDDTVYQFLMDTLLPEIWNQVSQPPLRVATINALLIVAAWPPPTIRFLTDPSLIFTGIAMSSSFLAGLHTGQGSHSEFQSALYKFDTTDEEATFTWAGVAILSHRVSSYMGCPSTNSPFNKTIDRLLDGTSIFPLPRYFAVHLETARFGNRLSRTMCASLEEAQGISHHLVAQLEEEYSKLQALLYSENSDLENFILLSTYLEIQIYYFMPLPGYSPEMLKRNVIRCYTTAEALVNQAMRLHRQTVFLHYAPHFVFRTLLNAICVIMSVHLSPSLSLLIPTTDGGTQFSQPQPPTDRDKADALFREGILAMRVGSVQEGDLHIRVTNMLEKYWDLRSHIPMTGNAGFGGDLFSSSVVGTGVRTFFTNRLGASLTFECLRRWKRDVEQARDRDASSTPLPVGGDGQHIGGVERQGQEGLQETNQQTVHTPDLGMSAAAAAVTTDPFLRIDWNAFMDDFDWSFTSSGNYLGGGVSSLTS